jgi:hypothetical protein
MTAFSDRGTRLRAGLRRAPKLYVPISGLKAAEQTRMSVSITSRSGIIVC